jgi:hypothetical protein
VHNSKCHSIKECIEIKKLTVQFREQQKLQPRCDSTPPRQREGKKQVVSKGDKDEEMAF